MAEISIKPEREYLHEIISKIQKGIYAIPSFQRSFVWREDQIIDLFDSIYKGYPIGSILLWKPQPKSKYPLKSRDIINDTIVEENTPEYYILDGRQRLTSFYGCVSYPKHEKEKFNLGYNLDKECFEYIKRPQDYILRISDFYDTFVMLEKLQNILSVYKDDYGLAQTYVQRARKINSILQSYQIGEILLENCDINEASTVFSRLNSKGTDISKVSMLQAVFYNTDNDILLSDRIMNFINSLSIYGFNYLKPDDILNCCYRYVGKNFYDSNLLKDIEKLDFTRYIDEIEEDIKRTVKFLHDDCYVLSNKLLPYSKQLIALSGFFKEYKRPSERQLLELKRWFFYTTYQQCFLNSSLTVVRSIFRRFEEFIKGEKDTAYDYKAVCIKSEPLRFRYSSSSALSNFLVISIIYKYVTLNPNKSISFIDLLKVKGNDSRGIIPCLTLEDKNLLLTGKIFNTEFLDSYALNEELIKFRNKDNATFCEQRESILLKLERELLESVGIDCTV